MIKKFRMGGVDYWPQAPSDNPILKIGDFGIDTDTGEIKAGDSVTHWNDLPSLNGAGAGGDANLPALGLIPELWQNFTLAADGTPTVADSGQAWTLTHIDSSGQPTIVNGRFTNTSTHAGTSAAYLTEQLDDDVTYMAAAYSFGASGSTTGQLAALAAWQTGLPSGELGAVPDSPCHLVFGEGGYGYGVYSDGSLTEIGHVNLPSFGTAEQHVEVAIDKPNNTAYVRDPTGKITRFTDPLIGSISAEYATCEVFYPAANTDHRVTFAKFAASSTPIDSKGRELYSPALRLKQEYLAGAGSWRIVARPTTTTTTTLVANTKTDIPEMTAQFVAPSSGQVVARIGIEVNIVSATLLYMSMNCEDGLGSSDNQFCAASNTDQQGLQHMSAEFIHTGLTPGNLYTLQLAGFSTQVDTSVVVNLGDHMRATLVVEPVY